MRSLVYHLCHPDRVGLLPDYLVMMCATLLFLDSVMITSFGCLFARILFCIGMFQTVMIWNYELANSLGRYVNAFGVVALWTVPFLTDDTTWISNIIHGALSGFMFNHLANSWGCNGRQL